MNSEFIRSRRRALSITQQELATSAGVSLATVQGIERGTANPSLRILEAVLSPLRVRIDFRAERPRAEKLSRLGVPIGSAQSVKGTRRDLISTLKEWILDEESSPAEPRETEAVMATLHALRDHYPGIYRDAKLPDLPTELSGRMIKLRRIALANLTKYL